MRIHSRCPQSGSNRHCADFKSAASANWAMGARSPTAVGGQQVRGSGAVASILTRNVRWNPPVSLPTARSLGRRAMDADPGSPAGGVADPEPAPSLWRLRPWIFRFQRIRPNPPRYSEQGLCHGDRSKRQKKSQKEEHDETPRTARPLPQGAQERRRGRNSPDDRGGRRPRVVEFAVARGLRTLGDDGRRTRVRPPGPADRTLGVRRDPHGLLLRGGTGAQTGVHAPCAILARRRCRSSRPPAGWRVPRRSTR